MKEKLINEGNYLIVEKFYHKLLSKENLKFFYVGDHILNDCLYVAKEVPDWKVIFVSNYLKPNSVQVHDDYSSKWGHYFSHSDGCEEKEVRSTYSCKIIKDFNIYVIPNIECILLLFDNI